MNSLFYTLVCIVCVIFQVKPLWAKTNDSAFKFQYTLAEIALSVGDPELATRLVEKLLNQDAKDFKASFLLSMAQIQLGNHHDGARTAGRAFKFAQTDDQKLQAARIAGLAKFNAGQYSRAEWWLRRAANHAKTTDTIAAVKREFQTIRQKNPISLRFSFSVAPSNNINGGSKEKFFSIDNLQFALSPNSLALSGIEYSGDIDFSYRLSQNEKQITNFGLYLYGRTYSLSSEAQTTAPNVSGSDYALTVAELSLQHRRLLFKELGPTTVSGHTGQIWYGGSPLWRYNRLVLGQDFLINHNASFNLRTFIEDQTALDNIQPDTNVYDVQGTYARRLKNQNIIRFTVGTRYNDAVDATYTYNDHRVTINYSLEKPVFNTKLSFLFGVGRKTYDEFSLSLDGRRDNYVRFGTTALFEKISYYGFSPNISLLVTRTNSNVTRFSALEVQGRIGVQSNF